MSTKENKNAMQVELFQLIQKEVSSHVPLAQRIAKVLGTGLDSAYRRIRGDYEISFKEAVKLCKHYGISLDELMYGIGKMQYAIVPNGLKGLESNLTFAQELLEITENIKRNSGEIILTAADLPVFHFIAHKELIFFQLFSWYKNMYEFTGTYEDFIKELGWEEIAAFLKEIHKNYTLIPSTEIWTANTMDSILKLLRYHIEMRHFNDSTIPSLICEQLFDVLGTMEKWIKNGIKESESAIYKFYINEIDIGNTFIFIKNEGKGSCIFRLFTINGLNIKDRLFCDAVDLWLASLIKRSSLISGVSTKERFLFLTGQKQKILDFTDTITTFQGSS